MKKVLSILAAIVMVIAASAAFAEENAKMTFSGGIEFNMDMDQVMERMTAMDLTNPEIEKEQTRGQIEFWKLEYENIQSGDGFTADVEYLFVGNGLVAIHYDFAKDDSYEEIKKQLAAYGEAVPFEATTIGNARYMIDEDGDLKNCKEMILYNGAAFVLEQDDDGEVEITILDLTAAYINN